MNFFEHQGLARRNTRLMVLLFALAVVGTVIAVDVALGVVYAMSAGAPAPVPVYVAGALATAALILLVSLFNIMRLAEGGVAVRAWWGRAASRPIPPIRSSGGCATWSRRWRSPRGCACPRST
jgi:hypothetical protein